MRAFHLAPLLSVLVACSGSTPGGTADRDGGAETGVAGEAGPFVDAAADSSIADAAGEDASDAELGSVDAGPDACGPSSPFGAPIPLASVNTAAKEGGPRLSADELTLYFSRAVTDSPSGLFVAHRASLAAPFDSATALTTLNQSFDEYDPTISSGLSIFFTANDRSGGSCDIWSATRASLADSFGAPSAVPGPVNSGTSDQTPFLRADGTELWFASNRSGGATGYDLYRAPASGSSFGTPVLVSELSSSSDEFTPTLSADGLVVFFSSSRPDGAALGQRDIWSGSRASVSEPFSNLADVAVLNSPADDFPGWLSADGCRLYMSRTGGGDNEDIYVATRAP